jgi:hypothetical protein
MTHSSSHTAFAAAMSINSCSHLGFHARDQPELALRRVLQANALAPAKPPSIRVETIFTNWLPFVALAAVYAATQVAAKLKVRRRAAARCGCRMSHGCTGRVALAPDSKALKHTSPVVVQTLCNVRNALRS